MVLVNAFKQLGVAATSHQITTMTQRASRLQRYLEVEEVVVGARIICHGYTALELVVSALVQQQAWSRDRKTSRSRRLVRL